jgi:type IV secretory pathway VirJ component
MIFATTSSSTTIDSLKYGAFGKVTIYNPGKVPEALVLFVSGDGGWNTGVIEMARKIAEQGALVAGIDIQHYFKMLRTEKVKCYYPASDFENLSMEIQKRYKFKHYLKPILMGYSSGATLVYGILAQAPANTFKGAISLGFCPDIEVDKPLCQGSGLTSHVLKEGRSYYLEAAKNLTAPFIVLQGMIDQVCSYDNTKKYMADIPDGELISLPNVGHGFAVAKNSLPQIIASYQKILKEPGYTEKIAAKYTASESQGIEQLNLSLPLTIIPSTIKPKLPLVFFISGDGGWSSFDHGVSVKLAADGMPVVGLDSQKYFWNVKQPKETADEMAKAISYYLKKWNRTSFIIIGYSFGACVAPFIANNFPLPLKQNLKGVFCLSPDETCDFEIHIADMLSFKTNEKYNVVNEMKLITSLNPVCIFGTGEDVELRDAFTLKGVKVETLPGAHHYDNDYSAVVAVVFKDYLKE